MTNRLKMDTFLASVERRAYKMAQIATNNSDEALDIVQDAMFRLYHKYLNKPESLWKPLFYRILQNRIRDWYRRQSVRNRFREWFSPGEESSGDDLDHSEADHAASPDKNPADMAQLKNASETLHKALRNLPLRQQQAFLLRAWEELSVAETATAMNCSEGSIKTHYSRAVHSLRKTLGDHWP